jgi:hypothetical protein
MGDILTSRGIYKSDENDPWSETIVREGSFIWLPSPEIAMQLAGSVQSGSISFDVVSTALEVLNVIKQIAIATSNVIVGICAGWMDANSFGVKHDALYNGLSSYAAYPLLFKIGFAAVAGATIGDIICEISGNNNGGSSKRPSVNQMNQDIKTGKSPSTVERVDRGKILGEQDHVHFTDGSALNYDGTWKHGSKALSNAEIRWLQKYNWNLPQ